jgi:predicted negative regulator of RcsB-dependent stress response
MARHLDLEEQEQLEDFKHFWKQYGNLISWVLIVVFGSYAAWNGWNYWQRSQAVQASVLYDEVERAAAGGDTGRVEQAFKDIQDKYGRTTYARQAGLVAAKALADHGKVDAAKAALQWVADNASDEGYEAIAKLRLAAVLTQSKAYDEALKQLGSGLPQPFEALAADRRGDIYELQGRKDQAKAEYLKAWHGLAAGTEYRALVEVKLTALGVDVGALKPAAESARS